MFEYVQDYGLKFNGALVPRKKTVRIIEHHTSGGPEETVQGIHAFHLGNKHKGIDYNFCVLADGTVVKGRGLEYCGGSVNNSAPESKGMNDDSVAIAALGDFEHNQMPEAQKEGAKRITKDVAQYYGITEIIKHKDVSDTDCPGRYYPFDEIKAYALGWPQESAPQPSTPTPTPEATIPNTMVYYRKKATQRVYFRSEPRQGDNIIRTLDVGTQMRYKGDSENGYIRVRIDGQDGYVYSNYTAPDYIENKDNVVTMWEEKLRDKGYYSGKIDGTAGPEVAKAIAALQRDKGLTVDYIGGPNTRKELFA